MVLRNWDGRVWNPETRRWVGSVSDPTPEQIARMCEKIREGWSEEEREMRLSSAYRNAPILLESIPNFMSPQ
jgi:hypothetical protein